MRPHNAPESYIWGFSEPETGGYTPVFADEQVGDDGADKGGAEEENGEHLKEEDDHQLVGEMELGAHVVGQNH